LPRRPAAVAHHAAQRRSPRQSSEGGTGNGQPVLADANRMDLPVAGRPLYELTGRAGANPTPPAPVMAPPPETTIELPIFKEMEAVWFRSHDDLDLETLPDRPRAGGYPTSAPPQPTVTSSAGGSGGRDPYDSGPDYGPADYGSAEAWRTAADSGWRAAAAAAEPAAGGSTRSGLPKRVPQAQYVPGSVDVPAVATVSQRRSPEEVRGLLSAYHRGVQRGRESGGR
jgi:hypothetical protein